MSILYNLQRINEVCKEHVENNFLPLPSRYVKELEMIRTQVDTLLNDTITLMDTGNMEVIPTLRRRGDEIKDRVSDAYHRLFDQLHDGNPTTMTVLYVYINILQETRELTSSLRKYLRAFAKLHDSEIRLRITPAVRPA